MSDSDFNFIFWFIIGIAVLVGMFLMWVIPIIWSYVKPWIHLITA